MAALLLFGFIEWIISYYYCDKIAKEKGYEQGVGWVCLLLGPFAILYACALPDYIARKNQELLLWQLQKQEKSTGPSVVEQQRVNYSRVTEELPYL